MAEKTRTVKVLRAFYFKGQVQEVGAIVELPALFAAEVIGVHKAEPATGTTAPAPVTATATEQDSKPKSSKGGTKNAEQ